MPLGKSYLFINLRKSAKHFQKWAVHRDWNVLYIDGEMSATEMQSRAQAAALYFGCDANDIENFRLICHDLEDGLRANLFSIKDIQKILPVGLSIGKDFFYITNQNGELMKINLNVVKIEKVENISKGAISKPIIYNERLYIVKNGSILEYN